jgi:hypothetical protein
MQVSTIVNANEAPEMFQIEHPDDYLNRIASERSRIERRNQLIRALRGSVPPLGSATEDQLRAVMREQLRAHAEPGR